MSSAPVLLIRAARNDADARALRRHGVPTRIDPYLAIVPVANPEGVTRMQTALEAPGEKWLVATSTNAIAALGAALPQARLESIISRSPDLQCAAVGQTTARALRALGARRVVVAPERDAMSLVRRLGREHPCPVVVPQGTRALGVLTRDLEARGFRTIGEVIYAIDTVESPPDSVREVHAGALGGVLLRSPSAAQAFADLTGTACLPAFCGGPTTAAHARDLGLTVVAVASDPSPASVAAGVARYLKEQNP